MSAGMFGLCCGCVPIGSAFKVLVALAVDSGWFSFLATAVGGSLDGDRYQTLTTVNTVLDQATSELITVTGVLTVDNLNGSIAAHTITASPHEPSAVDADPSVLYSHWPPDPGYTANHAAWGTDQSIDMSDSVSLANTMTVADGLLASIDPHTITAGAVTEVAYTRPATVGPQGGAAGVGDYWVASYIGSPPAKCWINVATGAVVLDAAISAYVTPVVGTTLQPLPPYPTTGRAFTQETAADANECSVSKLLAAPVTHATNHCFSDVYVVTGGGNSDGCGVVSADALLDELLMDPPALVIDPSSQGNACTRTLFLHHHPTVGGDGCPCIPD